MLKVLSLTFACFLHPIQAQSDLEEEPYDKGYLIAVAIGATKYFFAKIFSKEGLDTLGCPPSAGRLEEISETALGELF